MKLFGSAKTSLWLGIVLLVLVGAVVAWRVDSRSAARQERETRERIQGEVKDSINRSIGAIKMCPLSDPDCDKRK